MKDDEQEIIEPGAAGAPEGAFTEPGADEVASMYKELGIKASVPSGKSKERPKTTDVRAKDDKKDESGNSDTRKKSADVDDKSKSKDALASDKDVDSGDDIDAKGKKIGTDSKKVSDKSEETDGGVRKSKSDGEVDSERRGEKDIELGDKSTGQDAHESDDETQEDEDSEGKRPGKSNPKVEQRFQKLASDVRERDEVIEKLQKELQETVQKQEQLKVSQEDPEYTIEDFSKVRDEEGNVLDLDRNQAELAWRRWKDGYDERSQQRQAEANRQAALVKSQEEYSETMMRQSSEAYDTLAGLMDEYPELVSTSDKFDPEFTKVAMPIIQEAIIYQDGTEPGNEEGVKPVIVGMKINPKTILDAMSKISEQKRSLPLNGINDNVDVRSNVSVPHGRSSDPTVNAANELYKTLNINKRF